MTTSPTLLVNELFYSLQGEGSRIGRPCFFIRLTGCPLRCRYCDTTYAFAEGRPLSLTGIVEEVVAHLGPPPGGPHAPFVEVTGGEPLAQAATPALLAALLEEGYEVALETAGSHDIAVVPPAVIKIVDRKTPDSGMAHQWLESNLDHLVPRQDELKFVLASEKDYLWARDWCEERGIFHRHCVFFNPVTPGLSPTWLAEQIIRDRLPVKMQWQLHKLLWPHRERGV